MANEGEFISTLGKDALLFRRLEASDALGRLPECRLELLRPSTATPIQATQLLGKNASLKIRLLDDSFRHIHGVVTRFSRGGEVGRFDTYHIDLAPWLWHLQLGADCRIFQDKTVVQILDAVFAEYGSSSLVEKKLSASFTTRPYTVQYRESDFAFVSRLMEEEGIYYYFKHAADQHTLVLCDNAGAHTAMPGANLSWAEKLQGDQLQEDIVTRWSRAHQLRSLKYAHLDYAAEKPTTNMLGSAVRTVPYPKPNDLEVFDYPGGQDDGAMGINNGSNISAKTTEGKRTAQLRVDAFESGHDVASGVTPWRPCTVGTTFTFKEHADAGGYLVTATHSVMEYAGYEANTDRQSTSFSCRFSCVPKSVAFQPERATPRALVQGPQTATVVGASGDEILTDKYGRVKVQFHWDRVGAKDAQSSCWVRVSHPWASKQFGMVALPRVGDEVVVEFMEGNPDRPMVTGRVYNADNMPPWDLPAQATVSGIRTRSSKGGGASNFNELRFDDKKGSEYVWFQAEKDHHHLVKNDAFVTIKHDRHGLIEHDSDQKIGGKMDLEVTNVASVKVDADTHVTLGADLNLGITGALNIDVGEALAFKVGQAVGLSSGQAMDIASGAALNMTATAALHIKAMGVVIDGGTAGVCLKSGGSFVSVQPDGVYIKGPMVYINSGGAAGSANSAAKASPAKPKAPKPPKDNKDPLAK